MVKARGLYMVDNLVREAPVVLKDVVVLRPQRSRNLLRGRQNLRELVIGDIGELRAVVFRNHQL